MKERRARHLGAGVGAVCVGLLLFVFSLPHAGFHIPIGCRIAAMLAAGVMVLAWYQRARWRRVRSAVWVCEQCNVIKPNKGHEACACGGKLRPLNEMNWLEMPPSQRFPGAPPDAQNMLRVAEAI